MESQDLFSLFMSLAKQKDKGGDEQICTRLINEPELLKKTFSQLEEEDPHRSSINVLHVACQEGLLMTAQLILEEQPDLVHQKSEAQWTPLMNACERGQM
jgi:ankyrin repeat protein